MQDEIRVKIFFTYKPNAILPFENRYDLQNGFLHNLIDDSNLYRGQSDYNVSFYGGRMHHSKKGIHFFESPLIMEISSANKEFSNKILLGLSKQSSLPKEKQLNICGMIPKTIEIVEIPNFKDKETFFTISPVLLKESKRKFSGQPMFVTCQHEDGNEILLAKQKRILQKSNPDLDLSNFNIRFASDKECEELNVAPCKSKHLKLHNQSIWGTIGPVIVEANPQVLRHLYLIGAGNSTGTGFGMIRPLKKDNK